MYVAAEVLAWLCLVAPEAAVPGRVGVWAHTAGKIPPKLAARAQNEAATALGDRASLPDSAQKKALAKLQPACKADALACIREAATLLGTADLLFIRLSREQRSLSAKVVFYSGAEQKALLEQSVPLEQTGLERDLGPALAAVAELARPRATPAAVAEVPAAAAPPAAPTDAPPAPAAAPAPADTGGVASGSAPDAPAAVSAPVEWADPGDDPVVQSAMAQADVLDGNVDRARERLRRALTIDPADEGSAVLLAELALSQPQAVLEADTRPFLALTPSTAGSRSLRLLLRERLGLPPDPTPEEGGALLAVGRVAGIAQGEKTSSAFQLRLSSSLQGDSNVAVVPDTEPTRTSGARLALDGAVAYRPLEGAMQVDGEARLTYMHQFADDEGDPLLRKQRDIAVVSLRAALLRRIKPWTLSADVGALQMQMAGLQRTFHQQVDGRLQVKYRAGGPELGLYASAAARDYVFGNAEGPTDRDGPKYEAGASVTAPLGPLVVAGRAGGVAEVAEGKRQRAQGAGGMLALAYRAGSLSAIGDVGVEYRHYPKSRAVAEDGTILPRRTDQRLAPGLRLGWQTGAGYELFLAYRMTRSLSTLDVADYSRHLATAGLEAQW